MMEAATISSKSVEHVGPRAGTSMTASRRLAVRWMTGMAIVCLCVGRVPSSAGAVDLEEKKLPAVVTAYSRAMDSVSSTAGPAPIERLYSLGMQVRDTLLSDTLLDAIDDSTFVTIQRRMRGFWLEREVFQAVVPQASFFLPLARSRGGPADTAFFTALRSTYGDSGVFPSYERQLTDEAGCTDFGNGELVKAYGVWNRFIARYPAHYSRWAREEMEQVRQELVEGTCACEDSVSVIRELRMFLRRFPGSELCPSVKRRLEEIGKGDHAMRYHCVPG